MNTYIYSNVLTTVSYNIFKYTLFDKRPYLIRELTFVQFKEINKRKSEEYSMIVSITIDGCYVTRFNGNDCCYEFYEENQGLNGCIFTIPALGLQYFFSYVTECLLYYDGKLLQNILLYVNLKERTDLLTN